MDCRGVVEVIAEEVDDEKAKETAEEKQQQQQESDVPVDRPGRPAAVSEVRSTGPVDRRAQHAQVGARSTGRSTD